MGITLKKEVKKDDKGHAPAKVIKRIEGVRGIIRISDVDVDGSKKLRAALLRIKGVSHALSNAVVVASGLNPNIMIGTLDDDQIKKLEAIISEPLKNGIPPHMLNRRKDLYTGENKHMLGSELTFSVKSDIDFMKKIRCYKGIRHEAGLPVRGQRTRSSFRTGPAVGGLKKKEIMAK